MVIIPDSRVYACILLTFILCSVHLYRTCVSCLIVSNHVLPLHFMVVEHV